MLVVVALAVIGIVSARGTRAAFDAVTSNPAGSLTAKRIFPGARTTAAYDLRDASAGTGTETNVSSPLAVAADGRTQVTNNWATTFSTTSYVDFDFNGPLPTGLGTSGVNFNFTFASGAATTTCIYFEVRRISTGAVLATHGSAGTPLAPCATSTTQVTVTTALASVTTTNIANDLRIRVYGKDSGSSTSTIDRATITGSSTSAAFTLHTNVMNDSSDPSQSPLPVITWSLYAGDATRYTNSTAFSAAYVTGASGKYVKVTFPATLPAGAVVTSATLNHSYHTNIAGTLCYFFEVYAGATLLATHGGGSQVSCSSSTTVFQSDAVSLPEITTGTNANNIIVRLYYKHTASGKALADLTTLTLNYYYD